MRNYRFVFNISCASAGQADLARVEEMVDLAMQELVHDDTFIAALGETQLVKIDVIPVDIRTT